jgi:hypothetical protein
MVFSLSPDLISLVAVVVLALPELVEAVASQMGAFLQ